MYKLIFFVPPSHVDEVKNAVFAAGGGQLGAYNHCAWQTLGEGEFIPTSGANPTLGRVDERQKVSEYRVEIWVASDIVDACLAALKLSHPYEVPVIDLIKLETV